MDTQVLEEKRDEKAYEVSFLTETEEGVEAGKRLIGQHGASVTHEFPLKKINLAYPIKHALQANFVAVHVSSEPQNIKSLERDLKANKNILRSLIVKLPKEEKHEVVEREKKVTAAPMRRASAPRRETRDKAKPLSNEAIEKKIEEILQ